MDDTNLELRESINDEIGYHDGTILQWFGKEDIPDVELNDEDKLEKPTPFHRRQWEFPQLVVKK